MLFVAQFAPQFDWPQSMDSFLDSLSRLNFDDYGYLGNSGVIEGISKALMMFPSTRKRTQTELMGKRHCVLVTASHPYPCPKEVLIPTNQILESGEVVEVTIDTVLADAETMARSLAESFISLSVICPSDMPMIKTIYDAGNQNPGSFIKNLKHPQLLLLISEQFPEAREALKQFEVENNYHTNSQQHLFHLIAESLSAEDLMLLQSIISNPLMEQQDDTMPIATDEEINAILYNPNQEGWLPDMIDLSWPVGTNLPITNEIVGNNSTMQQGSNLTMQQGSPSDYLQDEQIVAEGSILITPEEKVGFNTLTSNNLWPLEVAPSNFSLGSTGLKPNYEQTTMTNFLQSQMNDCFGKFTEMPIPEGTATGFADQLCQRTIPKANDTFHFSTPWLEKYDPSHMLKASNSKALVAVNISQHLEGETHNPSMLNLQHKMPPHFYGATSANMGANKSKKVPRSNTIQVSKNNASGTKYVSSTNMKKIGIDSSRTRRNDVLSTNAKKPSINTSRTRDLVLSPNAPISVMSTSGMKDDRNTNTPIIAMNTSAAKIASPRSSSYLKKPKFSGATPLPNLNYVKIPNAQSSNHNLHRDNLSSEAPSGYIKAWEGSLTSRGLGVTLFVSKVVAYRQPTDSEKNFENWPKVMQVNHLVSLDHMSNSPIKESRQYLAFSVLDQCPTWDHMNSKNLCAYIDLPGQTLILWISANKTRLMGMLCDGVIPVYSHQIFKPTW